MGGGVGVNHLPPGYTDNSRVRIPIKMSDVDGVKPDPVKKSGFFRKLSTSKGSGDDFKMVTMSRGDYLKYWAKGEDGQFLPSVVEPEEGRQEWYRKQVEISDEIERNDPIAGKGKRMIGSDGPFGFGGGPDGGA